jgi:Chromosome segregation protein Csm1/Pcs1
LKSRREQVETLKKENAALQAQCKEQGTTSIDHEELQQFNRWKKNKSYMDPEASHEIMSERDRLKAQVAQLTTTVRLREQERDIQIEKAKATDNKKSLIANGIYSTPDGSKNDKTEMYEDLTGLLLTDVKKSNDSIVYNCLQTGRNGSKYHNMVKRVRIPLHAFPSNIIVSIALHFKLTQNNNQPNELHYQPMLDERRDADLIMRLPDYLTTEIEFTRDKANLFFWRLLTFLQSSDKKDHASKH